MNLLKYKDLKYKASVFDYHTLNSLTSSKYYTVHNLIIVGCYYTPITFLFLLELGAVVWMMFDSLTAMKDAT